MCACGRRLYALEAKRCVQCMKADAERLVRVWRYVLYG